jgi:hypothetical protein
MNVCLPIAWSFFSKLFAIVDLRGAFSLLNVVEKTLVRAERIEAAILQIELVDLFADRLKKSARRKGECAGIEKEQPLLRKIRVVDK